MRVAGKRVLMIVGDYVEDYEAMVPFQALQVFGHIVHAVCPGKKAGETVRTAVHQRDGAQTYTETRGHDFALNATFDDIDESQYDALMLPGGRAPEYLRLNPRVLAIVRFFAEQGRPIGAICHGVQLLTAARAISGKRVSGYPACAPEVDQAGGTHVAVDREAALTDGNLVTAPAWPAQAAWMAQFLTVLGTRIEHPASRVLAEA